MSNLIHGKTDANATALSQPSGAAPTTSKGSIFQTMSTHHTTKVKRASQIGNPAIFDSITKTRFLPRGVLFEASKRMEASGSFSRGAGLVKLSDNSGWAIIPRQDELTAQYRNYHGGAASVKEGEASRAFEEVGNAVVDPENSIETPSTPPIWVRVVAKNGIPVACPPPDVTVAKDDDTSPTSSAGSSSFVSNGGSNFGVGCSVIGWECLFRCNVSDSQCAPPAKVKSLRLGVLDATEMVHLHSAFNVREKLVD